MKTGHIYYCSFRQYCSINTTNAGLVFFNGTGYNYYFQSDFSIANYNYVPGTWQKLSYYFTAINDGNNQSAGEGPGQRIYMYKTRGTKPDSPYEVGFYDLSLLDLTEMYGAGREPSKELCDLLFGCGYWQNLDD